MGDVVVIHVDVQDGVRLLTLDRADVLNAFDADQFELMAERVVEAGDDDGTKVVVVTGAGRAFSAGFDLASRPAPGRAYRYGFRGLVDAIIDLRKPLLLAVNGLGVGWGATMLGLADAAFMAEGARLRCPFSTLGLTAEGASTYTFPRIMGPQAAARFLLGAEWWSAAQCKADRLVVEMVPDGETLDRALAYARHLAGLPLASLLETKDLLVGPHRAAMHQANADEHEGLRRLGGGPANREALAAFREKRPADFTTL